LRPQHQETAARVYERTILIVDSVGPAELRELEEPQTVAALVALAESPL